MPLAHILMPQLARKAKEIEDAIGPARPLGAGYLNAGYEKTQHDPKGLLDKQGPQSYDSSASVQGGQLAVIGQLQKSGAPAQQAFAKGLTQGWFDKTDNGAMAPGASKPQILPNAAAPSAHPAPIGMDERGNAIYANAGDGAARPPTKKKGKTVIQLDPRAAVGVNERGESVTARGTKQLGYLPTVITKSGEHSERSGARHADRRKKDIILQKDGTLHPQDTFGTRALQAEFGDDLKEVQENRDARGRPTDTFPHGYLDSLSAKDKKAVEDGVAVLKKLERGRSI